MKGWVAAYVLTLAAEPPLWALLLRKGSGVRPLHGYRDGLLANATSHPLTWLVLYPLLPEGYAAFVTVEAFAVTWEALLLRWRVGRDLDTIAALSLLANGVSLALGAVVLR